MVPYETPGYYGNMKARQNTLYFIFSYLYFKNELGDPHFFYQGLKL